MTSHHTWGSVTALHDFGGMLGRPLDTLLWALTISWSRLLAYVWSGPEWLGIKSDIMEPFNKYHKIPKKNWQKYSTLLQKYLQLVPKSIASSDVATPIVHFMDNTGLKYTLHPEDTLDTYIKVAGVQD